MKIFAILLLGIHLPGFSMPHSVGIGDKVPDVRIENIDNYKTRSLQFSELKGKLVIIDFWNWGCTGCIEAFPKLEDLQKRFGDKIQILLATRDSKEDINKYLIEIKRKPIQMPDLPSITGDTVLSKLFPYESVSHQVWILPDGVIYAITYGYNATEQNITALLEGRKVFMEYKVDSTYQAIQVKSLTHFLTEERRNEIQYSAVFTRYLDGMAGISFSRQDSSLKRTVAINCPLGLLFADAFNEGEPPYSNCWLIPDTRHIWEVSDTLIYLRPFNNGNTAEWNRKYTFCYEQLIPLGNVENAYKYMQQDLNRYFGALWNIEGVVEKRKQRCLVLTGNLQVEKVKSAGGEQTSELKHLRNYPFGEFCTMLLGQFRDCGLPVQNDIQYSGNVDLDISVDIGNITELNRELKIAELNREFKKYGMELKEEVREVKMLVVRDKKG